MKTRSTDRHLKKTKCTMCLKSLNGIKNFLEINRDENLQYKIKRCFKVQISEYDVQKTFICQKCVELLGDFIEMQNKFIRFDRVYFEKLRKQYLCDRCNETFSTPSLYHHHHLRAKHECHECDLCGNKFLSRKTILNHMIETHMESLVPCKICGAFLKTKDALSNHAIQTHGFKR